MALGHVDNLHEQPKRLRLRASYDYSPVTLRNGSESGRLSSDDLGLPDELVIELKGWNEIYYDMRDWKDPATFVSTELERKLHFLCGLSLAQRIANHLDRDVYFFDPNYLAEDRRFSPGNP